MSDFGFISEDDIMAEVESESPTNEDDFGFVSEDDILNEGYQKEIEDTESGKMGYGESALTGFGEGASLGTAPLVSGLVGAGLEGTGLGDKIGGEYEGEGKFKGMTPNEVDDELRAQGFDVEKKGDFDRLMEAFYSSKDAQIAQQEKSFEDNPLTTLGGNLVGGIATMSGGAGVLGAGAKAEKLTKLGQLVNKAAKSKALKPLVKLAPSTASLKGKPLASKLGLLGLEGAKAGGIAAFGSGKERLIDEDKSLLESGMDVAKETGIGVGLGGAGGSLIGGGLMAGGTIAKETGGLLKGAGKWLYNTPWGKKVRVPYEAQRRGLKITDEQALDAYFSTTGRQVKEILDDTLGDTNKKALLKEADKLGIEIDVEKNIDKAIQDIYENKAGSSASAKELDSFVDMLRQIDKRFEPSLKQEKMLDLKRAKKLAKAESQGFDQVQNKEGSFNTEELIPGTKNEQTVLNAEDIVVGPKGKVKKLYSDQVIPVGGVEVASHDLKKLTPSQAERIQNTLGDLAYSGDVTNELKDNSTTVQKMIRNALDKSLEGTEFAESNKIISQVMNALDSLNIKKDFNSTLPAVKQKVIGVIEDAMTSKARSGQSRKLTNFLENSGLAQNTKDAIINEHLFARDLKEVTSKEAGSGWISNLANIIIGGTGAVAGAVVKQVSPKKSHLVVQKALIEASKEGIDNVSKGLLNKFGDKAAGFARVLQKASEKGPGVKRNAIMYGLTSNPAFMKMVEDMSKEESNDE